MDERNGSESVFPVPRQNGRGQRYLWSEPGHKPIGYGLWHSHGRSHDLRAVMVAAVHWLAVQRLHLPRQVLKMGGLKGNFPRERQTKRLDSMGQPQLPHL